MIEFCARATRNEDVCGYSEYESDVHSASNQQNSSAVSDEAAFRPEQSAPRGTPAELRYTLRGQPGSSSQ